MVCRSAVVTAVRRLVSRVVRSNVTHTAIVNYSSLLITAGASVLVARLLGPEGRGEYAAIMTWFGLALVVGEFGQSGAITHWVARFPQRASMMVASARLITVGGAVIVGTAAMVTAPWLAGGDEELTIAYWIVFLGCFANGVLGPYTYAAQAISIRAWNLIRVSQPLIYVLLVVAFALSSRLTIVTLALALTISTVFQHIIAGVIARSLQAVRGSTSRRDLEMLARYGAAYAGSQVPATVGGQYDKAYLSQTVPGQDLGQYAVAGTIASLSTPLATAISSVVFPRMSADRSDARARVRLENRSLAVTAFATGIAVFTLAAIASPLVSAVFGAEFQPAVELVWWLVPATLCHALSEIIAVLIRSRSRPGQVTVARLVSLAVGAGSIVPLVKVADVTGAAISLTLLEVTMLVVSAVVLARLRKVARV
ncbi:hypothetical protein B4U78_010565 [Microbacterium esteraromaticum]|nr:hypothetical protein B4U78_010565 [Microbacterium esteraromaticum]